LAENSHDDWATEISVALEGGATRGEIVSDLVGILRWIKIEDPVAYEVIKDESDTFFIQYKSYI